MNANETAGKTPLTYVLTGKVYPERAPIHRLGLTVPLHLGEAGLRGTLDVRIQVSQVTAIFSTDAEVANVHTLKNIVEEWVRLLVDIAGYMRGGGYDVELVQMIPPGEGGPIVFGVGASALEQRAPKPDLPDIIAALNAPHGDSVRLALGGIREAIRTPKDTGFFCYRAVESIRQLFGHGDREDEKKRSWECMKQVLNVAHDDLMFLKNAADAVRHGESPFISAADRERALLVASAVIDSAVAYLKSQHVPTPSAAEPLDVPAALTSAPSEAPTSGS